MRKLGIAALAATAILVPTSAQAGDDGDHYTACVNEDGPGPCVWDARHTGNGVGHSFFLKKNGHIVYLPHRLAHDLLD